MVRLPFGQAQVSAQQILDSRPFDNMQNREVKVTNEWTEYSIVLPLHSEAKNLVSGLIFRLFAALSPWVFAARLPSLARCGPEGYQGLIVDGLMMTMVVLAFACRPKKASNRLVWDGRAGWNLAVAR